MDRAKLKTSTDINHKLQTKIPAKCPEKPNGYALDFYLRVTKMIYLNYHDVEQVMIDKSFAWTNVLILGAFTEMEAIMETFTPQIWLRQQRPIE